MIADIEKDVAEKSSKKIIFAFSIIGSALAGVGAILFISANWQYILGIAKIISLAAITFIAAYSGYYLEYENKNYPKTGSSLLFLSAMLFGALIFLTAQTYHVESAGRLHLLVLIWLLSIIPYVYLFKSKAAAVLSIVLFFTWLAVFITTVHNPYNFEHAFPLLFCCTATAVFSFGKFHEFITGFEDLAPVFEKISVFIIFLCLFIMTFGYFSKQPLFIAEFFPDGSLISKAVIHAIFLAPVFILLSSFIFNPSKIKHNDAEIILILCIFSYCLILNNTHLIERIFSVQSTDYGYYGYEIPSFYRIFINIFFALSVLGLILTGYLRKRMFYVNLGILWLVIFIILKYFDIFWKLLPRAAFFLAGGGLLIGLAWFFEHKRREIKTEFKKSE